MTKRLGLVGGKTLWIVIAIVAIVALIAVLVLK